ncbi:MAG: hypothetical protein HY731_01475 [Candidatus Tectomicrobia bacterium]|nr:hypothetical protein [Candidatus Tectomicrobia bacterium]
MVFEGAREVIWELTNHSLLLFGTTAMESEIARQRLEAAELLQSFTLIAGSDIGSKKETHLRAFAEAGGAPFETFVKESVYFAGTPEDVEIAREFGVFCIGIANLAVPEALQRAGAKEVVRTIMQL